MSEHARSGGAPDLEASEWREGWRIIAAAALAAGTGVALLFMNFSIFILPLADELGVTRGDLGMVQALIITAALGAPVIGRLTDIYGVRPVYFVSTVLVTAINLAAAVCSSALWHMALVVAATGFVGIGSTSVVLSRPINAHFRKHRGKALGLMAVGVSLTGIVAPPLVQQAVDLHGWRGAFGAIALAPLLVGVPAVALLMPPGGRAGSGVGAERRPVDRAFLRERDFWLLTLSLITMSLATAGAGSQLSPMIQDEGLGAATAALALSSFAAGQFVGRLGGGWLLDRFEPRKVAFLLTLLPASGFIVLLVTSGGAPAALLAAAIIGVQQGAELDIFAYFVGRRFAIARYGTIYGSLVGLGWIGNVGGLLGMGRIHDIYGSYALGQVLAIGALIVSAMLVLAVRLPPAIEGRTA